MYMENKRYRTNDNFTISEVAGEKVMLPVSDSVDKLGNMYLVNETADFVLTRLMDGKSIGETVNELTMEYEIGREVALEDVVRLAETLEERGFISEI